MKRNRYDPVSEHTYGWTPVSTFEKRPECVHCSKAIMAVVAPLHWPIETVAGVCYACGRVLKYADNLLLMTPRQAVVEFEPRRFAVRRGVAMQPSNGEVAREMILLGLESGLSAAEVAAELHVDTHFVKNIERAAEMRA